MAMHVETPLIESTPLSKIASCRVFLKLENCQPAASFKIRGIGLLCSEAKRAGSSRIICSSGGNAGLAAAYASRKLDMPCKIFVPGSTSEATVEKLRAENAEVEVVGKVWDDANKEALKQLELCTDSAFVHPFDHPTIWKGHSTMVHEMKKQMGDGILPGAIIASVGGGGLLTGIIQGLDEVGWSDVPLVAMETKGADSLAASMNAGKLTSLSDITSIAKTLGSKTVCQQLFDYTKSHRVISEVVTDEMALNACFKFSDDERMLVEPSCGASLAAVYSSVVRRLQTEGKLPEELDNIVVVVCGGSSVTIDVLNQLKSSLTTPP
ncbi:serine dehydratase-like [Watersipora subatra]|uniref:serine dehydratase-like n=1 Tax=Watersipora subatra TaxID=2589382 RepID=UPI00355C92B2